MLKLAATSGDLCSLINQCSLGSKKPSEWLDLLIKTATPRADALMTLYESLTATGKGGAISDTIMSYDRQAELEEWCVNAIPGALGPLLMTLISPPSEFNVKISDSSGSLDKKNVNTLKTKPTFFSNAQSNAY